MPLFLVAAVIGLGVRLAWRVFKAEQGRLAAAPRRAAKARRPVPLERDPTTGIYRPRSD